MRKREEGGRKEEWWFGEIDFDNVETTTQKQGRDTSLLI